jgi:hypothetical protein
LVVPAERAQTGRVLARREIGDGVFQPRRSGFNYIVAVRNRPAVHVMVNRRPMASLVVFVLIAALYKGLPVKHSPGPIPAPTASDLPDFPSKSHQISPESSPAIMTALLANAVR